MNMLSQHNTDEATLLEKLVHQISMKDAGKRNEYGTIKEMQDLHEQEFLDHQRRRCISFVEEREQLDESDAMVAMLMEEDSDDAE